MPRMTDTTNQSATAVVAPEQTARTKTGLQKWLLFALLSLTAWGVAGFVSKLVANRFSAPSTQVLFTIGTLPLVVFALLRERKVAWGPQWRAGLFFGALAGLTAALGNTAYFAALRQGLDSIVTPTVALYPVISAVLAMIILRERLDRFQSGGILLAVGAFVLLSLRDDKAGAAPERFVMAEWLFYALLALLIYGFSGFVQKLATDRVSAHASLVAFTIGSVVVFPWLFAGADFTGATVGILLLGVLLGLIGRLGEYLLLASLVSGAKVSVAVPLTATYPLITLALAAVFLGERLTTLQWSGIALALIAGVLMSFESREPNHKLSAPGACEKVTDD